MRKFLAALIAALALTPTLAHAVDQKVSELAFGTTLTGALIYLDQAGSDRKLGLNTSFFGVSANAVTINDGSLTNSKLANSGLTLGSTLLTLGLPTTTVAGLTLTAPTIAGAASFTGVPTFSGLSTGTCALNIVLNASNQLITNACSVGGTSVTWPATGTIVVSNSTNSPTGITPVQNSFVVGTAGPAWGTLASANSSVMITSAGGVPSFSTTLPAGLTVPGYSLIASPTFTGIPAAPTAAQGDNSTQLATTAFVKSQQQMMPIAWIAGQNPNGAPIFTVNQPTTVKAIVGRVGTANGSAATVTINKVASGTACASGTIQHSGSFNANGTAATNQTLTLVGGATNNLAVGDSLCLQTTGGANWTSGAAIGGITVFTSPQ